MSPLPRAQSTRFALMLAWATLAFSSVGAAQLRDIRTVFLIILENHDWSAIKGDPECPFINNVLLPMASYANDYRSPAGIHPSQGNYIWLEAGANFDVLDDGFHLISTTNHLASLLDRAGLSWRCYEESISGTNCPTFNAYPYALRHCPPLLFSDVFTNETLCIEHIRPYEELARDLESNSVAAYNIITPNMTNNMHDLNPAFATPRAAGDHWLSEAVPIIMNSSAYTNNGAIFITWDEGTNFSDGPMGMIVLSPLAKGHGYSNSIPYTHSATLRTMQEIFGVRPFLGDAANSWDLGDLFDVFALNLQLDSQNGLLHLTVSGIGSDDRVLIERSEDLTSWTSFATNNPSGGPVFEAVITNQFSGFFRAVSSR